MVLSLTIINTVTLTQCELGIVIFKSTLHIFIDLVQKWLTMFLFYFLLQPISLIYGRN